MRITPAMAGAVVLVGAAFGSVVFGDATDGNSLRAGDYQTISAAYTGSDGDAAASGDVDISRDFDRDLLEKQAETQAKQREQALADLVAKTQDRADELEQDEVKRKNQWVLPVAGYHLTARFGQRSSLWSSGAHTGLDFAGPSGSTIVSVAAGTVKSAGYEGSYGNRTVITLADGTDIWYCHQSRMSVSVGEKVDPGQVIGYTGSTGNVTGPHLHLEIHPGGGAEGNAIDPVPVLAEHGVTP
jgi:murein DD-endopeptidase MepM/ murein hydrolase activator NlpD